MRRSLSSFLRRSIILGLTTAAVLGVTNFEAHSQSPLIIANDRGGSLKTRYLQIDSLYRSGREVRIVGPRCESSCTLYLGLDNVCISPDVRFGFHGPSLYGVLPLSKAKFENLSITMSTFYPEPVRSWFLNEARHSTTKMAYLTGDYFLSLGYRKCA